MDGRTASFCKTSKTAFDKVRRHVPSQLYWQVSGNWGVHHFLTSFTMDSLIHDPNQKYVPALQLLVHF